jgi:hypothetical protein
MKKISWIIIVILVIAAGFFIFYNKKTETTLMPENPTSTQRLTAPDVKNATFVIENTPVTLENGLAGQPAAPGSADEVETRLFGEPVLGDLNGDNVDDAAVFLIQSTGGTGTFFYLVALVSSPTGYTGSSGIFLGDRIMPGKLSIDEKGTILAYYKDRRQDEPFSAQPTIERAVYAAVRNGILVDVSPQAAP